MLNKNVIGNMLVRISLIFSLVMLLIVNSMFAGVNAKAELDTNGVLIGEHIKVTLSVETDELYPIVWPQIQDSAKKIEIISEKMIDTNKTESGYQLKKEVVITSFEPGSYDLSPVSFLLEKKTMGEVYPLQANIPVINFATVVLDSNAALIDIKAPMDEPLTFKEILPWILWGLLAIALLIAIVYFVKRLAAQKTQPILKFDPKIPPHILAFQQLKALEDKKLWQDSQFKEYYIQLTQIIRLYIERRFEIQALEMTSNELMQAMNAVPLNQELRVAFDDMLENADLVKFAKYTPLADTCVTSIKACYELVEMTKLQATEENH